MKGFVRMTKLTNIGGRADYISNPKRQEEILAKSESVDWKQYQEFEQAKSKTLHEGKSIEGRELIIALPNSWAKLPPRKLQSMVHQIAVTSIGKSTDMQWAVHWNKAHTNLHLHVIFSERQKEENPKTWDRDIYLTADGKVARKKSERATNPDGSIKPPIHRKGEIKDGFTVKDPKYKDNAWLKQTKLYLETQFGRAIERPAMLHEYHEGKGPASERIRAVNERIRATNRNIDRFFVELPKSMKFNDVVVQSIRRNALKAVNSGYVMDLSLSGTMLKPAIMTIEAYRKLQESMKEPGIAVPTYVDQQQLTGSGMARNESDTVLEKAKIPSVEHPHADYPSVEQKKPESVKNVPMKPQTDERGRMYSSVQKKPSETKMGQMRMNSVTEKIAEMKVQSQMANSKGQLRKNRKRDKGMDR